MLVLRNLGMDIGRAEEQHKKDNLLGDKYLADSRKMIEQCEFMDAKIARGNASRAFGTCGDTSGRGQQLKDLGLLELRVKLMWYDKDVLVLIL